MVQYALRLDYVTQMYDVLLSWLSVNCTRYFVVREVSDADQNPHLHSILYSEKSLNALRLSLKKSFKEYKGNSFYSLKQCDDDIDAYMRYMCKGVDKATLPEVWGYFGFHYTKASIQEYHDMYWVNNEALRRNKRKRGELEGNMVEQVERIAKAEGVTAWEKDKISKIYIRLYVAARKPINVFAARAVVNTVVCILDGVGGSATDNLVNKICDL